MMTKLMLRRAAKENYEQQDAVQHVNLEIVMIPDNSGGDDSSSSSSGSDNDGDPNSSEDEDDLGNLNMRKIW